MEPNVEPKLPNPPNPVFDPQEQPILVANPSQTKSGYWIAMLVLIFAALASYLYWQSALLKQQLVSQSSPMPANSPTTTLDPTSNWQTYTNLRYKYSFKYPADWKIKFEDTYQYSNVVVASPLDKSVSVVHFLGKPESDKPNFTKNFVIDENNNLMISFDHCIAGPGLDCAGTQTPEDIEIFNQILTSFKISDNSLDVDDFLKEIVRKYLVENKQDITHLKFSGISPLGQHQDVYVVKFTTLPPESDYGGEWLIVGKINAQWIAPGSGHNTTCNWVKTAGFTDESDIAYYGQSCPQ